MCGGNISEPSLNVCSSHFKKFCGTMDHIRRAESIQMNNCRKLQYLHTKMAKEWRFNHGLIIVGSSITEEVVIFFLGWIWHFPSFDLFCLFLCLLWNFFRFHWNVSNKKIGLIIIDFYLFNICRGLSVLYALKFHDGWILHYRFCEPNRSGNCLK